MSGALANLAQRLGLRVSLRPLQQAALQPPCFTQQQAGYSSGSLDQHQDEIERINEMFVAARDEIEYAQEDAETVYFNESCEEARTAVSDVLEAYNALLGKLSADERGKLQRSMGLKMEQLKAEVETLDTLHAD